MVKTAGSWFCPSANTPRRASGSLVFATCLMGASVRLSTPVGRRLICTPKCGPWVFFLPAQTAGYFFALGGIVANSVHGGAYQAGFVHSYVTRLRVMSYDGSIRIIDQEDEVRYWRNSFGLLGIILGIEFQLEHRDRLQMYTVTKKMEGWSAEDFWSFIKRDAEADVPRDVV